MAIESWGKSGVLGYFCHIFWDVDFTFVLPTIHFNIKSKTQLEVKWTILSSKMDKSGHISIRVFA